MRKAQDELIKILPEAMVLQNVTAPAEDDVTVQAVKRLREKAGDGEGCLLRAVQDGIDRFQEIIDQVDASIKTYNRTEDVNTRKMT